MKSAQYRMTGIVLLFPEDWVPPNVSPSLARFKLLWESFITLLEQAWKTLSVCLLCFFPESPFFCTGDTDTVAEPP